MLEPCSACSHERREELDAALSHGEPYQDLREDFSLPIGVLKSHRRHTVDGHGADSPDSISGKVRLGKDRKGTLWVLKEGAGPEHVREEFIADQVYRSLRIPVPLGRLRDLGNGRVIKAATFIAGNSLGWLLRGGEPTETTIATPDGIIDQLRKGFAADVLLGNRDVIGPTFTNVVCGEDSVAYRVDNGSALRRRALGDLRPPDEWTEEVHELRTMRDPAINPSAAFVFSGLSDEAIACQIRDMLVPKRSEILGVLPGELQDTVNARIGYMERWADDAERSS